MKGLFSKIKYKKSQQQQAYHHRDVRVLREACAWAAKKMPPQYAAHMVEKLKVFALQIKEYCNCPEVSWIEKEKAYACLFCGTRHKKMKLLNKKQKGEPIRGKT